jgi:hypothetical protein
VAKHEQESGPLKNIKNYKNNKQLLLDVLLEQ